mmetsp:Transcript_10298/g.19095  ORF Transcript_10298/g.19095 Transcript_10298/m.19095 type:complete len:82 (-) Transcript_10298:118-363(-)
MQQIAQIRQIDKSILSTRNTGHSHNGAKLLNKKIISALAELNSTKMMLCPLMLLHLNTLLDTRHLKPNNQTLLFAFFPTYC